MLSSTSLQLKKSVDDVWPVTGKRVLVRVDFNVPIHDGVIENDYGIRSAIPTIRRVIDQGGICILISHLGRPQGVDGDDAATDLRMRATLSAQFQENRGKTAFFSSLNGEDKSLILSWSSASDQVASVAATSERVSRTALFSRLAEEEKKSLLERFVNENKERVFPQLASASGFEEEYSLKIVAVRLAELLGQHVYFAHDCLFAKQEIMKLRCGEVMLLENVRFYTNETSPDEQKRLSMAKLLASYGDVFINDAFGSSHRSSATITGIPKVMAHGCAGYLVEREIIYFAKVLNNPPRPMLAIVGGAKVSVKIRLLENLLTRIDRLILGGGIAYTFLKAMGHEIGSSMCELEEVERAGQLLKTAIERKVDVYLPIDHICNTSAQSTDKPIVTPSVDIPDECMALDIGPRTMQRFKEVIGHAKSAIWNGPMGVFEIPCYANGTFAIAAAMASCTAESGLLSIVGGGKTAGAAAECGEASRLSHVSTGGSASLALLEGRTLPGIDVLDDRE